MTPDQFEAAIKATTALQRKLIEGRIFWNTTTGDMKVREARVILEGIAASLDMTAAYAFADPEDVARSSHTDCRIAEGA